MAGDRFEEAERAAVEASRMARAAAEEAERAAERAAEEAERAAERADEEALRAFDDSPAPPDEMDEARGGNRRAPGKTAGDASTGRRADEMAMRHADLARRRAMEAADAEVRQAIAAAEARARS